MITRRSFLKALASTTALVAVPGAAFATVNHDEIMALVESKMDETLKRTLTDMSKDLWNDESGPYVPGGLQDLL